MKVAKNYTIRIKSTFKKAEDKNLSARNKKIFLKSILIIVEIKWKEKC